VLTYLGIIAAVFGIRFAFEGNIRYALICLMVSGICDAFDGSVANLKERTDKEKYFGIQIDTLADIINFGVLPAVIGYAVGVTNTVVYSMYILAALIRLAYFTVIEIELLNKNERRTYYEGLPVTNVALIIPLMYSICDIFDIPFAGVYTVALVFLAIAFVLRIKITKPRGLSQVIVCLLGIPVLFYIILFGG